MIQRRLKIVSLSIEYPNPTEPGKGLFVRARLQALAERVDLTVISPIALLDYAHPQGRMIGPRRVPEHLQDGAATVFYPRWIYPPYGGFINGLFLFLQILWPLWKLNRMSGIDLIDAHFTHPDGVATALAAWVLGKPFTITMRGSELSHGQFLFRRICMRWALRRAARVIAVADNLRDFATKVGVDPGRVTVIANGIDGERFYPSDREGCRAKFGIGQETKMILSAGHLAEIKGHHRVIEALGGLRRSGADAELLIAGGVGRSGRFAHILEQQVSSAGLNEHVRFLGEVDQPQLAELMSAADVFCLASSREGCPNVATEALACGTPVVATDVGAVRRLVPSDQYGKVVEVSAEAIQVGLRDVLSRSWDRETIAAWGRSRPWKQVACEVLHEMNAAVAGPPVVKTVIVNADDLGISKRVNDAIFELMKQQRVTSASIMSNGPALEDAVRGLRQVGRGSFGVHLNLTEFEPLSRQARQHLTGADGRMHRDIVHRTPTPARLRAIYQEFCSQIERVLSLGVAVSHIDSHHHVHTTPWVFPVIRAVQAKFGIRRIRISKNIYTEKTPCPPGLRVRKAIYNWMLRQGSETTDGFTEFVSFWEAAQKQRLEQRTIELMVHPGAVGSEEETGLLRSPWEERMPFQVRYADYANAWIRQ